jgi:hypothetical protein
MFGDRSVRQGIYVKISLSLRLNRLSLSRQHGITSINGFAVIFAFIQDFKERFNDYPVLKNHRNLPAKILHCFYWQVVGV